MASTNSIAVIDGSYIYGCALRTRVVSRGCVSLSFWRLWPLQIQLQWLTGVTLTNVRLNYITCNSLIVSPLFLERNLLRRIILLQWKFDVSETFFQSTVAVTVYLWNYFVVTVAVTVLLENWGILFINFCFIPFWEKKNLYFCFNLLECLPCGWMTDDLFTWIHRLVTGSP